MILNVYWNEGKNLTNISFDDRFGEFTLFQLALLKITNTLCERPTIHYFDGSSVATISDMLEFVEFLNILEVYDSIGIKEAPIYVCRQLSASFDVDEFLKSQIPEIISECIALNLSSKYEINQNHTNLENSEVFDTIHENHEEYVDESFVVQRQFTFELLVKESETRLMNNELKFTCFECCKIIESDCTYFDCFTCEYICCIVCREKSEHPHLMAIIEVDGNSKPCLDSSVRKATDQEFGENAYGFTSVASSVKQLLSKPYRLLFSKQVEKIQ